MGYSYSSRESWQLIVAWPQKSSEGMTTAHAHVDLEAGCWSVLLP